MPGYQSMTIGISTLGGNGWLGGVNYTINTVQALSALPIEKRPRIYLIVRQEEFSIFDQFKSIFHLVDKLIICAPFIESNKFISIKTLNSAFEHIDFLYPVLASTLNDRNLPHGSWITDFQHKYLPNFFSNNEIEERNFAFNKISQKAKHVVFSSKTALNDFNKFYPDHNCTTHVLHFASSIDNDLLKLNPFEVAATHNLNSPFFICCNQFWTHKDHLTAFQAIAILKSRGLDIILVCTGNTNDYRNPSYFSSLQKQIEHLGIINNVVLLGEIPRNEQISLIRYSLAMIQPSLFEGWSTVVEDSRSLGKSIFLTDIPVHREQNPEYGIFFPTGNAQSLADSIHSSYDNLLATDQLYREQSSLQEMKDRRLRFGIELVNIAYQAINDDKLFKRNIYHTSRSNTKYLVSAIVSTYNSENFIARCLDDLVSQTLYTKDELEIIVIDSNSEQNEKCIVNNYINKFKHITYIKTEHRETIYQSWNRGCKIANGKYITNANADDRHRQDALERLAEALESHPEAGVAYANSLITNRENETFATASVTGSFVWPEFDRTNLFRACFLGPQPMWRKSLHEQHGYFDGSFKSAGDYEFWLRLAASDVHFQHVPECLGLYLMSQEGVEHSNQGLSFHESEIARSRHWNPKWGARPTPGGSYFIPMRVSWSKWLTERPETPLVSVVIPTKDRPEMLREAVESVLNQTYPHVEAVVVNDAGTDVQKMLATIPNSSKISYIHLLHNAERSTARNCGIVLANGNYIAYLDDDDIFYPNHVDTLLAPLRTKDYKVAYSDSLMAQQSNQNGKYITLHKTCYYSKNFDYQKLLVDNYIPILCLMHEKKCIEKSGYFDTNISTHEDWDLWIRLSSNFKFLHLKEITSEYRMRNDNTNTTNSKFPKFLETYKYIYKKYSTQSTISNLTSLDRKKTLFAINLRTYDYICNLISDINKHTNKSTTEISTSLIRCGANENQIISATIYLQSMTEKDTAIQRQLLLRSIKSDHENYLAWLALCQNYIEDGNLELVEKTLKTLIDANPLDVTLYDSLINIAKILNNIELQRDMTKQKELMCHIIKENQQNSNTL